MKCTHEQAQSQSQSRYQQCALVTSIQSLRLTYKHVGARPGGRYDMRSSRIITDYILTQFHTYAYIYLVTAGSFRIST